MAQYGYNGGDYTSHHRQEPYETYSNTGGYAGSYHPDKHVAKSNYSSPSYDSDDDMYKEEANISTEVHPLKIKEYLAKVISDHSRQSSSADHRRYEYDHDHEPKNYGYIHESMIHGYDHGPNSYGSSEWKDHRSTNDGYSGDNSYGSNDGYSDYNSYGSNNRTSNGGWNRGVTSHTKQPTKRTDEIRDAIETVRDVIGHISPTGLHKGGHHDSRETARGYGGFNSTTWPYAAGEYRKTSIAIKKFHDTIIP